MNVVALRESFELILTRAPDLTRRFCEILFARYPEASELLGRNARGAQEEMLTRALAAVLDHVEDAAWLTETLGALGAEQVGYGVTDEMYTWVGDALILTLADVAGDDWTPGLAKAWSDAYAAIQSLMLAGAHRAQAEAAE